MPERFDVALLEFVQMSEGLAKERLAVTQANTPVKIDVFIDYT
ncbi:MAG: hypothetical protein QF676_02775 [Dehalococcoidia bacterium]|nr:hypothetical protein [Dehalococcoidia bacterium]MDP7261510.1 hypothetical protein [Dehalococcoidia bacterium]MDP7485179.1 hypothetical protein [Dehalococcoidia bacterium]